MCGNYRRIQGMRTFILRFDHLYWVPEPGTTQKNPCFAMCLEALKTGRISANARRVASMIYLNDAVELAYKLICAEAPGHGCYHISSAEAIGQMELARKIQREIGSGIEIVDNTVGMANRLILDNSRYKATFLTPVSGKWRST